MTTAQMWLKRQKEREEARLYQAELEDHNVEGLMMFHDSNFYGLHHLLPMTESLAYISMECAWPKKKETK